MERTPDDIKKIVKEGYAAVAKKGTSCCSSASCCSLSGAARDISKNVGYSDDEMNAVPSGSNLGLGCGNPVAIASLKQGEVVLDLGSGAGFDAFLAAKKVGKTGRVIGVDMTQEMLDRARANARNNGYDNVEFRLGDIERLPLDPDSVDVVISNCVINLSPDKQAVFNEAFRVLKPGGRMMVSDLVLTKDLPDGLKQSVEAYVGCFAGAVKKEEYLQCISAAGFQDVRVMSETAYPVDAMFQDLNAAAEAVVSVKVSAIKPKGCSI